METFGLDLVFYQRYSATNENGIELFYINLYRSTDWKWRILEASFDDALHSVMSHNKELENQYFNLTNVELVPYTELAEAMDNFLKYLKSIEVLRVFYLEHPKNSFSLNKMLKQIREAKEKRGQMVMMFDVQKPYSRKHNSELFEKFRLLARYSLWDLIEGIEYLQITRQQLENYIFEMNDDVVDAYLDLYPYMKNPNVKYFLQSEFIGHKKITTLLIIYRPLSKCFFLFMCIVKIKIN